MLTLVLIIAALGVFSAGVLIGLVLNAPAEKSRAYDWQRDGY